MDKYIFNENMLFVEAITQCFLKEKNPIENELFYFKNAKWREKVNFVMSYFSIVGA